ncbi:hypothetical protein chiPu_0003213 [Chiloscyllium punctatum]|uniref:CDK-activating kinase assembly factor MAT1 n=1 Tax=Chiloscyllium punctatum TaxID=137246 RepID=A0A401S345_CHIPU|nr:hypothetical protein [Chiloscyllium punctatum]
MDDQRCPRCKTTKYRNPSLKLMVNVCGHTLCESCVELLFIRGSGNCQECGTALRKNNFRVQLFEDPTVDKEVEIRKKVLKIYNKREDDFCTLKEYNDFLEEVEDIGSYETMSREQEDLEEALEFERQESDQKRMLLLKEEQMQQLAKKKNKKALIDDLESSQLPVSMLLAQHKDRAAQLETQLETQQQVRSVTFSTGIKMGQQISLQPMPRIEETLYVYQPLQIETYGPRVPGCELLGKQGYLNHVRTATSQDLAGGYTSSLACYRALQDAFSGLFWQSS